MTDVQPFNISFPAESIVFVVDEYSQYKKMMIDDYCYTHSPIVITDIGQLIGTKAPIANKNLLLDCVLKWDDIRQYNHVADILRFHTAGLLMHMNKPVSFDPLIRANVDYLVLFRGRNLRHLQRIYRQYLSSFLNDSTVFTSIFKSLGWGQGLVLDLAAMQLSGRFEGNYYKYAVINTNTTNTCNTCVVTDSYANLDIALDEWVVNGKSIITESSLPLLLPSSPLADMVESVEWEVINTVDYADALPTHAPHQIINDINMKPVVSLAPEFISESAHGTELITESTQKYIINIELPNEEIISDTQKHSGQQGWSSYIYNAWSWLI